MLSNSGYDDRVSTVLNNLVQLPQNILLGNDIEVGHIDARVAVLKIL